VAKKSGGDAPYADLNGILKLEIERMGTDVLIGETITGKGGQMPSLLD
jgi:hypothetical protein